MIETETEDVEVGSDEEELAERLAERDDVEDAPQSVGTLRDTFEEEELDSLPDDEILETSGILSHVQEDGETIGHVLMIEWDDVDDVMTPIKTAKRYPGISVLLRSSARNYHLYGLSVRDRNTQLVDAMRKNGDVFQARWAARRGYFVLRLLAKFRSESREPYKPAPEPVKVFSSESEHAQSAPHIDILKQLATSAGREDLVDDLREAEREHELVGDGAKVDHYQTVTDEAKEVL